MRTPGKMGVAPAGIRKVLAMNNWSPTVWPERLSWGRRDAVTVFRIGERSRHDSPRASRFQEEASQAERNAAKRLLPKIRRQHPHLKFIVIEDGLASNGPHVRDLLDTGTTSTCGPSREFCGKRGEGTGGSYFVSVPRLFLERCYAASTERRSTRWFLLSRPSGSSTGGTRPTSGDSAPAATACQAISGSLKALQRVSSADLAIGATVGTSTAYNAASGVSSRAMRRGMVSFISASPGR